MFVLRKRKAPIKKLRQYDEPRGFVQLIGAFERNAAAEMGLNISRWRSAAGFSSCGYAWQTCGHDTTSRHRRRRYCRRLEWDQLGAAVICVVILKVGAGSRRCTVSRPVCAGTWG